MNKEKAGPTNPAFFVILSGMSLYKQELIDHYRNPRHYGTIPGADFTSEQANPACGDTVCFTGTITNLVITDLAFTGSGCVISLAAASLLAEQSKGQSVPAIMQLGAADMKELIGLELGPVRLRCALLALQALQQGISCSKDQQ